MAGTLRTVARYWLSLLERRTGMSLHGERPEQITNFHRIDPRIMTGGQPTERQIAALARAGVRTVINLAPHDAGNALPDEPATVAATGMAYHHIPVDFAAPTEADYARFRAVMAETAGESLFVHCAANMRVSAFLYRWRREQGVSEAQARADLERLWEPKGVWRDFISGSTSG